MEGSQKIMKWPGMGLEKTGSVWWDRKQQHWENKGIPTGSGTTDPRGQFSRRLLCMDLPSVPGSVPSCQDTETHRWGSLASRSSNLKEEKAT